MIKPSQALYESDERYEQRVNGTPQPRLSYRLFGWWYRWQACKMAARVMQAQGMGTDNEGPTPRIFSITVYFEQYMLEGEDGTADDFGPKEPVELKSVTEISNE